MNLKTDNRNQSILFVYQKGRQDVSAEDISQHGHTQAIAAKLT